MTLALTAFVSQTAVYAHAAWFVQGRFLPDWSFALQPLTLVYLALAVSVCVVGRMAGGVGVHGLVLRDGVPVPWLARLAPYMPFCVRIHAGLSLIVLTSLGMFLTPAIRLHATPAGYALAALTVTIGTMLIAGWRARVAAWLLLATVPLGMLEYGDFPVLLGSTLCVGSAVFLLVVGPGRWSSDWELGRGGWPTLVESARAVWALRAGAGLALVLGGFSEKLADPAVSLAFLKIHPAFDFLATAGLPITAIEFVRLMGAMEVLMGLLLIAGVAPQLTAIAVALPFTATVLMLGGVELAGHLQAHAVLIVLLVYAANPRLRATTWMLWPWQRRPVAVRVATPRPLEESLIGDSMET
jgi:hypothetical protein